MNYFTSQNTGAHANDGDASSLQEEILDFFHCFGLSHFTIYFLSFISLKCLLIAGFCCLFRSCVFITSDILLDWPISFTRHRVKVIFLG